MDDQEKFEIIKDCVIPDDKGIDRRFPVGEVVEGSHYEQFIPFHILKRLSPPPAEPPPPPEEDPPPPPEDPPEDPSSDGTVRHAREQLEQMKKTDILKKFPGLKGTKAEIINQILEAQDAEDA